MKRHINFYIILSLILCIVLCSCKNDDSIVTQTQSSSEKAITSGTEETSVATTMIISKLSDTSYYFACVDFVEEFTNLNEGGFEYFEDTNEIKIGVTKSTGTYTGCLDGPMLEFTVNLTTEEVTDKEYIPQPDDENFQVYRPDNDELDKMSNERLVEVAKMFCEKISSDEVDMSNYEENKKKLKAQTTTEETETTETTTAQTLETQEKEIKDNSYILTENSKLLCFCGCFNYDSPCNKFQTLNSDSINNFINKLNKIEYISYEKLDITGGGNWAEGYWDVMIYKDGVLCYDVHTERDVMYIIDNTINDKSSCTILTINDDIRHEFEKKVFDFNNDAWEEYVNSNEEYWKEIGKLDTYAGTYNDNSKWTVLVAGNDFAQYKEIENKYTKYHDFRKPYYKTVKYSYNELEKSSNIIKEKMKDYSVFNVNINVKNNLIEVYMIEDNEDYKNAITELSPIKDLKFIVSNEYLPQENPKT